MNAWGFRAATVPFWCVYIAVSTVDALELVAVRRHNNNNSKAEYKPLK